MTEEEGTAERMKVMRDELDSRIIWAMADVREEFDLTVTEARHLACERYVEHLVAAEVVGLLYEEELDEMLCYARDRARKVKRSMNSANN